MTLNVNKSISTTCIINVCNVHIKLLRFRDVNRLRTVGLYRCHLFRCVM